MGWVHCRRFAATAVWAVVTAIGSPATAAEITWKAGIWGQPRVSTEPIEWFVKELAKKTGGQMKIELAYDRAKAQDAVDQVSSGASDGAFVCTGYFGDKMPLVTVIDLPMFAPENITVLGQVELALADHPAIRAELRKWNIRMALPVVLPQYQLMGTRRIAKLEDLRGARVRISAEMGKVLEEFGATIRLMSGPESLAALKNGSLDVVASPYPSTHASFKIHEGSKHVTEKISLGTQLCYFGVSHKAWDALPVKVQEVMLGLRQPAVARYAEIYARDDAAHIAMFKQRGMEFVSFNPVDRARLVAKAIKYWQAWIDAREKQGLKGREVFEFTQAKIREFSR
jgi:TRAP-type C4-dicarboxylate transport system substrate-binding protein